VSLMAKTPDPLEFSISIAPKVRTLAPAVITIEPKVMMFEWKVITTAAIFMTVKRFPTL